MSSFKDTFSATASKSPNGSTLSQQSSLSTKKEKRPHSEPDFTQDTNKKLKNDDNSNDSDEIFPEPPKKISFGLSQKKANSKISFGGIKIGLQKPASTVTSKLSGPILDKKVITKPKVASAFEDEEDEDEEEEMPPEAKMRMKNIGRDTPTSAGPNSFGKGRMGFCDAKKLYERQLKETEEKLATDKGK